MVWLKIDDQIAHHPKFIEAGPLASWLWVCGNGYCNKYLTDGYIPQSALKTLGTVPSPMKWAERLVAVGLWERAEHGYQVHDFHDYNPKAEVIRSKRKTDRLRKESARNPQGLFVESKRSPVHPVPSRPVPSPKDPPPQADARSKRPIFTGQKLTVFEWMLDDCEQTLGTFAEAFDLHEWFFSLDAQALKANLVIPKRDGGAWLQAQLVAEAKRRGVPLVMAGEKPVVDRTCQHNNPPCENPGNWQCQQRTQLEKVKAS